jgi:hypothetical protein
MKSPAKRTMRIVTALLWIGLVSGCGGGRTVLIADDSPVRIGPHTTGTIYTLVEGQWQLSTAARATARGLVLRATALRGTR